MNQDLSSDRSLTFFNSEREKKKPKTVKGNKGRGESTYKRATENGTKLQICHQMAHFKENDHTCIAFLLPKRSLQLQTFLIVKICSH